ncbi:hypothetical protein M8745_19920 [Lutimaribacter sp. EGI FJ00014]|nr:hypothetical protein [Lutimaribacter sp. EGI FJ00014]
MKVLIKASCEFDAADDDWDEIEAEMERRVVSQVPELIESLRYELRKAKRIHSSVGAEKLHTDDEPEVDDGEA